MESDLNLNRTCYYCGDPAVSEDHLPPSCIFPDPKPSNRISVPSCKHHNSAQSSEDEYFRWFIATASAGGPLAQEIIQGKIVRQFQRKPKLIQSILRQAKVVDVSTPSGIYLGKSPSVPIDRDRIQSVITRMTKGLFLHFYGQRLPADYSVLDFLLNPELDDVQNYLLSRLPLHEIGTNVFGFKFTKDHSDPFFTSWFYRFYDKTVIATITSRNPLATPIDVQDGTHK